MGDDNQPSTAVALAGSTATRRNGRWVREPMAFEDVAGAVALAEDTGYASVWVPDHGVWDPFALLAAMADGLDELGRAMGDAIPRFLAALGPSMAELAGRAADGVLLNWCPPERVARARGEIASGAEAAGRDPAEVTVAVYVRACLGHDEDHALGALAEAAEMYAGIPAYRRQLERDGVELSPEPMARALCVWGDRDGALDRLAAWRDAGADLVVVYPVPAQEAVSSLMGTIMAAAPDPAVER